MREGRSHSSFRKACRSFERSLSEALPAPAVGPLPEAAAASLSAETFQYRADNRSAWQSVPEVSEPRSHPHPRIQANTALRVHSARTGTSSPTAATPVSITGAQAAPVQAGIAGTFRPVA